MEVGDDLSFPEKIIILGKFDCDEAIDRSN
jgi:hypothetical protein